MREPSCAVAPPTAPSWLRETVAEAGCRLGSIEDSQVLIWFLGPPDELRASPQRGAKVRWVALASAGVDGYRAVLDEDLIWTAPKGVYAETVAEHALALSLAGFRNLHSYARANTWTPPSVRELRGASVIILGGGGIGTALIRLLRPLTTEVSVVTKHPRPIAGARRVLGVDRLHDGLAGTSLVVVACALTSETAGIISSPELRKMEGGWLVNVARGACVRTDDLVTALHEGWIRGAALDVTDPEPLPAGHPLWSLENCLITPHTANTVELLRPHLRRHLLEILDRFRSGRPLVGTVDVRLGY